MNTQKKEDQFAKIFDELRVCMKNAEVSFLNATLSSDRNSLNDLRNEIDCLAGFQEELMPLIDSLDEDYANPECPSCGEPEMVSTEGGQGEEKGCRC